MGGDTCTVVVCVVVCVVVRVVVRVVRVCGGLAPERDGEWEEENGG